VSYPDAQRYRIGVNYDSLPVNKPQCPYQTYNRDGSMRFDGNGGASPNYEPNSFGGPTQDPKYVERPRRIASTAVGRYNHRDDSDFYTQPGNLFRLMKPQEKERLIGNIAASLSNAPRNIQERQLCHFFRADPAYGEGVAKALGIPVKELAAAK
jgi:catalase